MCDEADGRMSSRAYSCRLCGAHSSSAFPAREMITATFWGIDRFIAEDISYLGRILVRRMDIFEVAGRYNVITFHHSLEHMVDQRAVLVRTREVLAENGCVVIRIPIVGGEAWTNYREH
jgi:hypothetical protein